MKIWSKSRHRRNMKPFKAIKGWMLAGAILTPIVVAGSMMGYEGYLIATAFFVSVALSAVTCVLTWHKINTAAYRGEVIPFAVCAVLFCAFAAGIYMLTLDEKLWLDTAERKPETAPKPEEAKPTEEGK